MWTLLKRMVFDETFFIGLFRAGALSIGTAISSGMYPETMLASLPQEVGFFLIALGGFVRSSSHPKASPSAQAK